MQSFILPITKSIIHNSKPYHFQKSQMKAASTPKTSASLHSKLKQLLSPTLLIEKEAKLTPCTPRTKVPEPRLDQSILYKINPIQFEIQSHMKQWMVINAQSSKRSDSIFNNQQIQRRKFDNDSRALGKNPWKFEKNGRVLETEYLRRSGHRWSFPAPVFVVLLEEKGREGLGWCEEVSLGFRLLMDSPLPLPF